MERLKGKTAMVVGAGSIGPGWGNGKATAVTFAREGAQVFCVDRNGKAAQETVDIITGEGGKAAAFTADASKASDVEAMVAACLKTYGRIDVLDNNVGIAEMGNVVEVTEEEWDRVFAVNLKSAFFTMKHVIPVMQKQGGGSIINISSIASIRHLGNADIVVEHIDTAIGFQARRHHRLDIGGAGNVGGEGRRLAALARDDLHGLFGCRRVAIDAKHLRTLASKSHRGRLAVAPARPDRTRADHHRRLALEPFHRLSLPLIWPGN